jgi:hypothetical protein
MAQTNNGNQLEITEKMKSHIDEMEIIRRQLLMEYGIALFATEHLKLKSLHSLNPLYLFFTKIKEIMTKKIYQTSLAVGMIVYYILILIYFTIPALPFNLFTVIVAVPIIIGYWPFLYWFYAFYKRIQLAVFRDYLKRDIRRELELLISYYFLLCKRLEGRPKALNGSVNTLEVGLREIREFYESVLPSKFLRNISLGMMSSILGAISIIKTITAQIAGIEAQTLINHLQVLLPKTLITPLFELPWTVLITVLILIPLELVFFLVFFPIFNGIGRSIRYSNKFFGEIEEDETKKIEKMLSHLSSSGREILDRIP